MPCSACSPIEHSYVYLALFLKVTVIVVDCFGCRTLVVLLIPERMTKLCVILPVFVTLKITLPGLAIDFCERTNLNSDALTVTVVVFGFTTVECELVARAVPVPMRASATKLARAMRMRGTCDS